MSYYIIIRGPLGSGKSTIAEKLSKILRAEHIAIDRILDEFNLTKDREDGYVSQESFKKANEIVVSKVKKLLDKGIPVIFDGNFYWKSQIEDLIKRLNYQYYVFTLKAPLEVCIDRDNKRNKTHGKDAAKVVYKKSTSFEYGISIDVTKRLDEVVKEILSYLPKIKSKEKKWKSYSVTVLLIASKIGWYIPIGGVQHLLLSRSDILALGFTGIAHNTLAKLFLEIPSLR